MVNNDEFGKLSSEQINKLAQVLAETEGLMKKQEKLIATVLDGEKDIANIRIASLETYFEIYSSKLNDIAKQYNDNVNSIFSILDKRLEKVSSNLTSVNEGSNSDSKPTATNESAKKIDTTITELRKAIASLGTRDSAVNQAFIENFRTLLANKSQSSTNSKNTSVTKQPRYLGNQAASEVAATQEPTQNIPQFKNTVTDDASGIGNIDLTSLEDLLEERNKKVTNANNALKNAEERLKLARLSNAKDIVAREQLFLDNLKKATIESEIEVQDLRNQLATEHANIGNVTAEKVKTIWFNTEKDILNNELKTTDLKAKLQAAQDQSEKARVLRLRDFKVTLENEAITRETKLQERRNQLLLNRENAELSSAERIKNIWANFEHGILEEEEKAELGWL